MQRQPNIQQPINDTSSSATAGHASTTVPTGCCAPFEPATWDNDEITWNEKVFVREHVHNLFHVPLDMGRQVRKVMRLLEAWEPGADKHLVLYDERSAWGSDIYVEAASPVPGTNTVFLSGTFLTKVYEGPYREAPRWAADMKAYAKAKGRSLKKIYFSYTTCPRCAKAYGKNYAILFGEVDPSS